MSFRLNLAADAQFANAAARATVRQQATPAPHPTLRPDNTPAGAGALDRLRAVLGN